jgi:hypothetical protein
MSLRSLGSFSLFDLDKPEMHVVGAQLVPERALFTDDLLWKVITPRCAANDAIAAQDWLYRCERVPFLDGKKSRLGWSAETLWHWAGAFHRVVGRELWGLSAQSQVAAAVVHRAISNNTLFLMRAHRMRAAEPDVYVALEAALVAVHGPRKRRLNEVNGGDA